jgi:indole-3-glycerol phosphate synthase
MSQILEKILSEKASEVSSLKKNNSLSNLEKIGHGFKRRGFEKILFNFRTQKKLAVIAEIKKASPSNGQFKTDFDVEEISISYESNGAACISVLTDKKFFMGSLENLALARNKVQLPVLRKDFIIDPIQVAESFAIGSDCILLIASALSQDKLLELESQAKTYGMDCLLEVHNEQDLIKVLNCKSKLVGINNRNLNDFNVDIVTTERLLKEVPTDKLVVSESGINGKAEVKYLEKIGVTSYLIGELLMKNKSPGLALKKLLMSCDKTIDIRSNEEYP